MTLSYRSTLGPSPLLGQAVSVCLWPGLIFLGDSEGRQNEFKPLDPVQQGRSSMDKALSISGDYSNGA